MKKEFRLTKKGVAELEAELDKLIKSRGDVAEKLKIARSFGDLRENTEYQNARDEQVTLESRINEIDHILRSVEIISETKKHAVVELGAVVTLKGQKGAATYHVVGSMEADPAANKISDESPIGIALMGKKVDEKVTINLPAGDVVYKITSIT